MLRAKTLDVDQQAAYPRPGRGTVGLECIADQDDPGLKVSLDDRKVHHPVLHAIDDAEVTEKWLQTGHQAQQGRSRLTTEFAHDRIGWIAKHKEIGAHAGLHGEQAEVIDPIRGSLAVAG